MYLLIILFICIVELYCPNISDFISDLLLASTASRSAINGETARRYRSLHNITEFVLQFYRQFKNNLFHFYSIQDVIFFVLFMNAILSNMYILPLTALLNPYVQLFVEI